MHDFEIAGRRYGIDDGEDSDDPPLDERRAVLHVLVHPGDSFLYRYDYGDNWEHEIEVEKALPADQSVAHPIYIDGERACPPEDVGGPSGYSSFLEAIGDPAHSEQKSMLTWAGGSFDPEHFDCDAFADNLMIQQLDF